MDCHKVCSLSMGTPFYSTVPQYQRLDNWHERERVTTTSVDVGLDSRALPLLFLLSVFCLRTGTMTGGEQLHHQAMAMKWAAALFCLLAVHHHVSFTSALNIGIEYTQSGLSVKKIQCSKKCESDHCLLPPFLRYGKYCGILYSGCPGEKPCDGLDACCMKHDACVLAKHDDYLSVECSQNFLDCISAFKDSGRPSFKGNKCSVTEVVDILTLVMDAALLAGRILHKP